MSFASSADGTTQGGAPGESAPPGGRGIPVTPPDGGKRRRAAGEVARDPGDAARPGAVLVVGLGNPILGDDGVGWRVVDEAERCWNETRGPADGLGAGGGRRSVSFDRLSRGGLALMERLVGAGRVVLVDALNTGRTPVGTVLAMPLEELVPWAAGHLDSAHDASLLTAMAAGRALGAELPIRVMVVGIEAERIYDFGEELSPEVEASVGPAAESVLAILASWAQDPA